RPRHCAGELEARRGSRSHQLGCAVQPGRTADARRADGGGAALSRAVRPDRAGVAVRERHPADFRGARANSQITAVPGAGATVLGATVLGATVLGATVLGAMVPACWVPGAWCRTQRCTLAP